MFGGGSRGTAVVNNTIVLNGGGASSGIFFDGIPAQTRIVNNIVVAAPNTVALSCPGTYSSIPPMLAHNVFFGAIGAVDGQHCGAYMNISGNQVGDPLLVDPGTADFRLTSGSPAVDAGLGTDALIPTSDFDGVVRVQDGNLDGIVGIDIGAFEISPTPTLDVDGSGPTSRYDPSTDGLLIVRYLFGYTGSALTNAALAPTAVRSSPATLEAYLGAIRPFMDIDGDGNVDALTDGMLIVRFLSGLRGETLLNGALSSTAAYTTSSAIEARIQALLP
jgi:hypothetical protein